MFCSHNPFCRLHSMLVRISDHDGTVLSGIEFLKYLDFARQLATILNSRYRMFYNVLQTTAPCADVTSCT